MRLNGLQHTREFDFMANAAKRDKVPSPDGHHRSPDFPTFDPRLDHQPLSIRFAIRMLRHLRRTDRPPVSNAAEMERWQSGRLYLTRNQACV